MVEAKQQIIDIANKEEIQAVLELFLATTNLSFWGQPPFEISHSLIENTNLVNYTDKPELVKSFLQKWGNVYGEESEE